MSSSLKVQFGKRLKFLRKKAGLTQIGLADAVGISVESISNMERGIFGPAFDNLEKIAAVLNIKVRVLFEFDEQEIDI